MFHSFCIAICFSLGLATLALAQTSISLSPPTSAADTNASAPLDASFAGFGIEPSHLFSFAGNDDTNQLSVQLLQNLADYAGAPPHIRLGGNTGDYMIFDESYTELGWIDNDKSTASGTIAADSIVIGPGFLKALDRFPTGTPVTYGLNLAYDESDYIDKIVTEARAALNGLQNVKLYSFEIGNEPDLYLQNLFRNGTWDGQTWTDQFLARADAVYNQVLQPAGLPSTFFEPPATASTIGTTFEIDTLVQDGLLDGTNGTKYASVWNQHDYYYFISVTQTPITLDILMDLDTTNTQFAYWEQQVKKGLATGLPYVLREMSSIGPIGLHGVSDTLGAALWTLNFFLYAASLNISSVQMHMTGNSNASAWQPITLYGNDPFVRPQYYAHAAVAQLVGNGNGTTRIAALNTGKVSSAYTGRVRAYTAYAGGGLQAVVLINSKQANASEASKDSFTFKLNLGSGYQDQDVYLSYLTADGADSLAGTTWNGMSYSNSSGAASIVDSTVTVLRTSSSGSVSIPVRDSQAVIANVGWLLGSVGVTNTTTQSSRAGKKSTAGPTKTAGACTAAWTGAVTTTLALASCVTGDAARETGEAKKTGEASAVGRNWWMVGVCLGAVMVGFFYLA